MEKCKRGCTLSQSEYINLNCFHRYIVGVVSVVKCAISSGITSPLMAIMTLD